MWMKECARRGFGRTMHHVQRAVQSILNQRKAVTVFKDNLPGKKWVSLFLNRHKDVTLRTPQALGLQRAAVTEAKLRGRFDTAFKEIQAAEGDVLDHPSRIFNCDESGFQLGGGGFSKVLASKGDKRVYQVSTDTHTQITCTVLACGSAAGEMLSPLIIFPGQRFGYDPLEGFKEAHFAKSNNGWIDGEIFTS
ncbi:tigger transposable element-derived protein 6-like protein [Elysia marginata]|uniref:Tigger transposable element-derived protein 6-like protein n=1 Tax=Elysia marginata TaxID=1093978 RepID=A0AAV4JUL2_9GAST|nr:tigger transposable element-derived protein 6-like protein [Elysia marginata]